MESSSGKEKKFLFLGALFILTGILFNEWILAALLSSDGSIAITKRVAIWIFDVVMIAAGIITIKKRAFDLRRVGYSFITLVILLLVIELGLHIANFILHDGESKELKDKRYLLSPYEGKEWAKDLFIETEELSGEYKEFRGWGKKEYHGKYINIDSNGVRKTWNPEDIYGEKYRTLYVFGPSNIWGFGARDDYTIPSYISRKLNSEGYKFRVYNYGEWGYAFNQELVYLIMLLRDGHRPDYVFFYGWADIYNAYQAGKPGTLHFSFSIRTRMKELSDMQQIWLGVTNILDRYSMIYKELMKWNKKLDPPESQFFEVAHSYSDDELKALVDDTVDYSSGSYELLDKLSKDYGFKYMLFWMPMIFTEDKLTEEEARVDVRLQDEALTRIYRFADEAYRTGLFPHFYNVTDALKGRTKTYYIDIGHLSEEGNAVVADRVFSIFKKEYLINE